MIALHLLFLFLFVLNVLWFLKEGRIDIEFPEIKATNLEKLRSLDIKKYNYLRDSSYARLNKELRAY